MSGSGQDEDKKPDQGGAHINLKVKGQVLISLDFLLFLFFLHVFVSLRSDFWGSFMFLKFMLFEVTTLHCFKIYGPDAVFLELIVCKDFRGICLRLFGTTIQFKSH